MSASMIHVYKLISLGLSYPAERNWNALAGFLPLTEDMADDKLRERISGFRKVFEKVKGERELIESEYLRIFDTGGLISPYETEYLIEKISRKPFELADISGFYQAFGFELSDEDGCREVVDHIAVELEFMALMALKEEYAREQKQADNLHVVEDAAKKFFKEHLATWGFWLSMQIAELDCHRFYRELGSVFETVLEMGCKQFGINSSDFRMKLNRMTYTGVRGEELTCGQIHGMHEGKMLKR